MIFTGSWIYGLELKRDIKVENTDLVAVSVYIL